MEVTQKSIKSLRLTADGIDIGFFSSFEIYKFANQTAWSKAMNEITIKYRTRLGNQRCVVGGFPILQSVESIQENTPHKTHLCNAVGFRIVYTQFNSRSILQGITVDITLAEILCQTGLGLGRFKGGCNGFRRPKIKGAIPRLFHEIGEPLSRTLAQQPAESTSLPLLQLIKSSHSRG